MPRHVVNPHSPACVVGSHVNCQSSSCCCACHETPIVGEEDQHPARYPMVRLNEEDRRSLRVRFLGPDRTITLIDDPMEEVDELPACNIKETVYGNSTVTYRIMPYEWDTELSQILYRRGVKEVSVVRESGELYVYTRTEEERWASYRTVPQE